jgi:hypothetical protein
MFPLPCAEAGADRDGSQHRGEARSWPHMPTSVLSGYRQGDLEAIVVNPAFLCALIDSRQPTGGGPRNGAWLGLQLLHMFG